MTKTNIETLSMHQLAEFVEQNNQPKFRATQIVEWLYKHNVQDFSQMTNLPKSLIISLSSNFVITNFKAKQTFRSNDGTKKYVFQIQNNVCPEKKLSYIETVGIPSLKKNSNQLTVCVSTQVGCAMACKFCATGHQGFSRNLSIGEIIKQVIFVSKDLNQRVSNIVLMGQGEPFLNFDNVINALEIINNPKCLDIGARKITISTCGLIPGINKLSNVNKQFGLAVSLHSAIQTKRDMLMPGVKKYSLEQLRSSLLQYTNTTNRRVTFEYLMLKDVNDSDEDLKALVDYCSCLLCHVNLIKFNSIDGSEFSASDNKTINKWIEVLNSSGTETTLRASRGSDIDAACGQLINKLNKIVSRET